MIPDRRGGDRLFIEFCARYRSDSPTFCRARALDFSLGGVRVESAEKLEPGTELSIDLKPEPLRNLSFQGKVCWSKPSWKEGVFECGISFSGGCKADIAWLKRRFEGVSEAVRKINQP